MWFDLVDGGASQPGRIGFGGGRARFAGHFQIERAVYGCMEKAGFRYNISPYWQYDMFEDAEWRLVANPPPVVEHDQTEHDEFRETRFDTNAATTNAPRRPPTMLRATLNLLASSAISFPRRCLAQPFRSQWPRTEPASDRTHPAALRVRGRDLFAFGE